MAFILLTTYRGSNMSKKNKTNTVVALFTKASATDLKNKGLSNTAIEIEATASMAGMAYLAMHYRLAAVGATAPTDKTFLLEQARQLQDLVEAEVLRLSLFGFGKIATEVMGEIIKAEDSETSAAVKAATKPVAPAKLAAPAQPAAPAAPAKPAKPTAAASITNPIGLLAAADPALAALGASTLAASAQAEAKRLLNEAETSLRAEEVLGGDPVAVAILADIVEELGLNYDAARLASKAARNAIHSSL